jgi:hypothetical protein
MFIAAINVTILMLAIVHAILGSPGIVLDN